MSRERLKGILSRQMSDREKRCRADFVVQTGLNKAHALHRIAAIVRLLKRKNAMKRKP